MDLSKKITKQNVKSANCFLKAAYNKIWIIEYVVKNFQAKVRGEKKKIQDLLHSTIELFLIPSLSRAKKG